MLKVPDTPPATYADTGKEFIPGFHTCYVVKSEVAWADGAFGFTRWTAHKLKKYPIWNNRLGVWHPPKTEDPGTYYEKEFYSTLEAAQKVADKKNES